MDAEAIGRASVLLGAGRAAVDDVIDFDATKTIGKADQSPPDRATYT